VGSQRWWHVAVVGGSAVAAVIILLTESDPLLLTVGLGTTAAFLAAWFVLGARCGPTSPGTLAFILVTIAYSGIVTAVSPSAAIVQCFVFPVVWTRLERLAPSLAANVGVAGAVGVGLFLGTGSLYQAVITEALSLGFSIGIGLWITQILTKSDERRQLLEELQAAQRQLATLSRDAGVTSERERLAREIHDTIAQDLTGLVLIAQRASRELASGDTAAASEQLAVLEEGARTALAETRALVASSAPPALDDSGIAAALERLGERFERETSMLVEVTTEVQQALDRDLEVVLLRCAQEGLANVRKHSGASRASIRLVLNRGERSLRIADNGAGFEPGAARSGFGLSGMRERLDLVGGTLDIDSGADGTALLVTLPREGTA